MKKGYTLIELLAVIVIIAIVNFIAIPIVLNVIGSAKDSAAKSQAYYILAGAKNYYSESIFDNSKKNMINNLENIYDDIEMSGKIPEDGRLYINNQGLTALAVIINKKCYKKEFVGELQIIDSTDCDLGYIGHDDISPTVEFSVMGNPFNDDDWANNDFYVGINVIDNESGSHSYQWCNGINDCEPISLVEEGSGEVLIATESDNNVVCVIGYDKAGNMSDKTCSQSYKLDKTNPVLEGINDIVVNKNDIVDLTLDVVATDSLSGIDGTFSYDPTSVDTSIAGTTNITYSVKDKAGNETTVTRKIIVDAEAPMVTYTALGDKINANGWSKEDFFVEALLVDRSGLGIKSAKWCSTTNDTCEPVADMVGSSMTPLISVESNNNRICIKSTDNNNKTSEVICSDSYKLDKTKPVITINGISSVSITLGTTYNDSGAQASDGLSGISGNVSVTNNVNVNLAETYQVTYNITDLAGNQASAVVRTVTVNGITQYRSRTSSQSCSTCYDSCPYSCNISATTSYYCSAVELHVCQTNKCCWDSGYEGAGQVYGSASVRYSCPSGYSLSGSTCLKTCYQSCNPHSCNCSTSWGSWSSWSTTVVTETSSRQVETRTCTSWPCSSS